MKNFKLIPQCLLIGDSLTQYGDAPNGFSALLRDHYQGRYQFQNLGISGINSTQLLEFLNSEAFSSAIPSHITSCVLCIGANDAAISGPQKVELGQFEANLHQIIKILQPLSTKILLIAPPPPENRPGRTAENTAQYAEICMKMTAITVVDLREKWTENAFLADGIHFNGEGNLLVFEEVKKWIGEVEFWRSWWGEWKE